MSSDAMRVMEAVPNYIADGAQEVPSGYKRTDVGVIPQDWQVDTLTSVTPPRAQHAIVDGPFGSNLKRIHYRHSGVPIITSGYVTEGHFCADEYLYVDEEKFKHEKRSAVRGGEIVMAKIGARCGACAILPGDHPIGILSGNALKIRVDKSRHSTFFIWQLLWSRYTSGDIEAWKSVGAQPAISLPVLRKQLFQLPPLAEQRAIAEALSDVDRLLGALEALIAKKRAIKQAAMQQLLTGKTRLPGFSGEWETKRLGEIGYFLKGSRVKRDDAQSGHLACVRYGEIYTTHHDYIREFNSRIAPEVAATATRLEYGDLLFAGSGETKEEIGKCVALVLEEEAYAGGDIVILRPSNVDSLFLGYALNMPGVARQKASYGQGDAVVHISAGALAQVSVAVPSRAEQSAIAAVLSDMDAEIAALEARRDKTRQIKQGMMQQLLTGRVRLVKPEAAT